MSVGCSSSTEEATYHRDVKPLLDKRCGECHGPQGIGPFRLDTYEHAKQYADLALNAVESGVMPPWTPDPTCRNYADERRIPDEEIEVLRDWIEADTPKGSADQAPDTTNEKANELGEPDIVATFDKAYTPNDNVTDDYHCFLLDAEFDKETYMTASDLMPDNKELVHHADIFVVNPFQVDQVEQLEQQHDGPGYPCFGDPGFDSITLLGAWVPGAQPLALPEDSAAVIRKGSRLVLQTHFNTLYTDPAPVKPEFQMWTRDSAPENRIWAMPFANFDFVIPPGESHSEHINEYTNRSDEPWHVLGVAAHMHLLGQRFRFDVERADGSSAQDQCLLDIPDWDFDWQQVYRFKEGEEVDVQPGDTVRMNCTFDNSPSNQPVIDGQRQQPKRVTWGGKTVDEMCLGFLVVSEPYEPLPESSGICDPFKTCRKDCEDPYGIKCLFNCATEDLTCGQCLLGSTTDCAREYCNEQTQAARPCIMNCAQAATGGGDIDACLQDECPQKRDALEACLRPRIQRGHCNEDFRRCEVQF